MEKKFDATQIKSGDSVTVKGYGLGKCVGWVGYPPAFIRIEFESGEVRDFHPAKLQEKIVVSTPKGQDQ